MSRVAIDAAIHAWPWPRPVMGVRWDLVTHPARPAVFLDTRDLGVRDRTALCMPVSVYVGDAPGLVEARIRNAALTAKYCIEEAV